MNGKQTTHTGIRIFRGLHRRSRLFFNVTGLQKKPKVFAVGFNKSGTSSMHNLFCSLGFLSYHGTKWRTCDNLVLLRAYDCFSDGIPRDLSKLDRLFPNSKFILQVRELEPWIFSRLAHIERAKKRGYQGHPTWDTTEECIKEWIYQRNKHHLAVLSYFSERPSDLLLINFIRDPDAGTKICQFLGFDRTLEKPKANVNQNSRHSVEHEKMVESCVSELNINKKDLICDILCPSLLDKKMLNTYPTDTRFLGNNNTPL